MRSSICWLCVLSFFKKPAIVSSFSSHRLFSVFGPTLSVLGCHLYHTIAPPKHAAVHPTAGNIQSLLPCKVIVLRIRESEKVLTRSQSAVQRFQGQQGLFSLIFYLLSRHQVPLRNSYICSITSDWVPALIPEQLAQIHGPLGVPAIHSCSGNHTPEMCF